MQTTVNMCETGDNNMTFTTVEQKIACEYIEACLRYSNFALNSLKQPILSNFDNFTAIENLKN